MSDHSIGKFKIEPGRHGRGIDWNFGLPSEAESDDGLALSNLATTNSVAAFADR
jgi:hypothetical protein